MKTKYFLKKEPQMHNGEEISLTKTYLTFNIDHSCFYTNDGNDREIINFTFSVHEEITGKTDACISKSSKWKSFSIDLNLADKDDIYSVVNALSCGINNSFLHIFPKPEPIKIIPNNT